MTTQGTPATDLRTHLDALRHAGELYEIDVEVDAELELPEIHRRVIAAGGPALLFRRVKGSPWPVVTNLFGTSRRVEMAFGQRPLDLVEQAAAIPDELVPPTPGKLWKKRGFLTDLLKVGMRNGRSAPVLQNRREPPDLGALPATKSWARDGGRFLTLPLVYTEHPDRDSRGGNSAGHSNLGIYRVQLFDGTTTGLHFQIGKGGGFHLAAAEERDIPLPVNIHLGGPPSLMLAALAPLPENVPEVLLASLLLGRRLPLVKNPAGPLPILAGSEFALVGEVRPGERRAEGPFGDHYGYYSETHDYPLFRCQTMWHRDDPIFPATVVGKPRQEDFFLGDFLQELLSPLIKRVMPGVRDLWSYGETGYHSLAAAVVHERFKREAMVAAFRILGEGQLSLTKFLLAVDRPMDLRDFPAVLTHVLERADFRTDLFLLPNLSMDSLDYAGPRIDEGSKGVLLGLGDPIRQLPTEFGGALPTGIERVSVFSPGCLVIQSSDPAASAADEVSRLAGEPAFAGWPLLVLADDAERAVRSTINFLWTTFTRFDPAADVHAAGTEIIHNHPAFTAPILIDARMKPGYPEELFCDEDTARLVEGRWSEYFDGSIEMGDSDRGHLD